MRSFLSTTCLALAACSFLFLGCGSSDVKTKPKDNGHDHDHDDHAHEHKGPHGGYFAEIGNHKYHVEWTDDENAGIVNLYILDNMGAKEVAAESAELVVVTTEDSESKEYTLAAVDPQDGKTSHYQLADKDLLNSIDVLSEAITAEIKSVTIEGEEFTNIKLVKDPEHHHE